jgi:NAD(P)-dependent dehydrogenase (short-subunit alcohol dehydrogenase family)
MAAIKLAVYYMRKNGGSHKGLIICTSSNAGLYPFPMAPMYAISKHGVVGAVRSFAPPLKEEGIRINALCPNCIGTSSPSPVVCKERTDENLQQRDLQTIN